MKMVRDKASEILSSGNHEDIDWLTNKGGYGKLMEDNVYIGTKYFDYMTTTSGELELAKRYLSKCGLKPELLDHWASVDSLDLGNPSSSISKPEPRAAAFPTIPFGQVYQEQDDNGGPSVSQEYKSFTEASEQGPSGLSLTPQPAGEAVDKNFKPSGSDSNTKALPRARRPPAAMFPKQKNRAKKTTRRHTPASDKNNAPQGIPQQRDTDAFSLEQNNANEGMLQQHDTNAFSLDQNNADPGILAFSLDQNAASQGMLPQQHGTNIPSLDQNDADQDMSQQYDMDFLMD